jgi:hypothetical protein
VWKQGEHVAIIGTTGSGKTYLENRLLKLRGHVIFFRTKAEDPRDDPMDSGWRRAKTVKEISASQHRYWLLDPPYERQHVEGLALFRKARSEGAWTVAIDELYGATLPQVGLEQPITWGLTQGRSGKITMVCGMQRPARVTRFALTEATHVFCFSVEGRDATEILAQSVSPRFKEILPKLDWHKHQFAYYGRKDRRILIADASQIERFM